MRLVHGLLLTLGSFLAVVLTTLYQPFYFDFENKTYDIRYGFRIRRQNYEDITIVDIDVRSLEKLGRFQSWPRRHFARVIRYLGSARLVGVDVLFSETDALGAQLREVVGRRLDSLHLPKEQVFPLLSFDAELAQAIKENGRVILVASYEDGRLIEPLGIFKRAARAVGMGNVVPDIDGVVRRASPVYEIGRNQTYPNFAFLMARYAQPGLKVDSTLVRQIAYRGEEGSFRRVSFYDVLEERIPREFFQDKVVLVGATALGLSDVHAAPFDPVFPGVELNANLIYGYEHNFFIKKSPYAVTLLLILLFSLAAVVLFYFFKPLTGAVITAVLYLVFLVGNQVLFSHNLWLEIVRPTYGLALGALVTLGYRFLFEERQKKAIRAMFGRYVSKEVVDHLVSSPPVLGGTRIEATVLFADIRNFTTLSEMLSPEAIVKILNDYFSLVTENIMKNRGMVDKFIGDGIMAVFGAPVSYPEHAFMAVKTALEMKVRIEQIREKYPIRVGIGVNTGPMICGNIGSHQRMDYTVVGDAVNLASRLEGLTKDYDAQIIVSEATYRAVETKVQAREIGWAKIKGKEKEVHIYEITGLKAAS